MAGPASSPPAPPALPVRGRRREADQRALRERIEGLMLQGLRAAAIHRALTGPEAPAPITISERAVRNHMRAIERDWRARTSQATLETERARAIMQAEELIRIANHRSALNARSNTGVGYLNVSLKTQVQRAKLRGLDAQVRTEITGTDGGPVAVEPAPLAHAPTTPEEELRRLKLRQDELEQQIAFRDAAAAKGTS